MSAGGEPQGGLGRAGSAEERAARLHAWLRRALGDGAFTLVPLAGDASFRRYYRLRYAAGTRIVMDAPPDKEDSGAFVKVARLLAEAGLHAPRLLDLDLGQGFLLLSDLGSQSYLEVIDERNADWLFADAIDALLRWQLATRPGVLPPYGRELLRRELELFPQWYLGRHLRVSLREGQRQVLEETFELILANNLAQPTVFVHRDYMLRNLLLSDPNPGVLDFQDAVRGPIAYDVVSLFRDAFISWQEGQEREWTRRYWDRARRAGLPVRGNFDEFYRDFEWMGVQRHLKVLGIFARLRYRDGKPRYLEDAPRFVGYLRRVAGRHRALRPFLRLLDALEGRGA